MEETPGDHHLKIYQNPVKKGDILHIHWWISSIDSMEPKNSPDRKAKSSSKPPFLGSMLIFLGVEFQKGRQDQVDIFRIREAH